MAELHEECGVFGAFANHTCDVASSCYYGLFALQHRGQQSSGIAINDDGVIKCYKDAGIVNDVFTPEIMASLGEGNMALGHVRYGATGQNDRLNAQPIVVNHVKGRMAICDNGSLTNTAQLKQDLELKGSIFHTTSDTEIISNIIIRERLNCGSIEEAVSRTVGQLKGAYAILVMSPQKMIAVRDPNGLKPLCYGQTPEGTYIVASESVALDVCNAKFIRDVEPGEIVVFDTNGVRSIKEHCGKHESTLCVFEYIYFARPDSVIDGASVHEARLRAGQFLAQENPVEADVVIGVPDSGIDAAIGYAKESGIPYDLGFIKNRYVARTFIAPGQKSRENKVKIKLNPISNTVKGKRVVLIDDSIVRGTTSERIVKLLRDAGATEVHMRVTAPPFINPCYYGTDIGSREVLIACNHTHKEMEKIIGVDSLGFLSLDACSKIACLDGSKKYCMACFNGNYPTEIPSKQCENCFEQKINKEKK